MKQDIKLTEVFHKGIENAAMKVLPRSGVGLVLWEPSVYLERAVTLQRRATRSDRAREGVVKGTECLVFGLRVDLGRLCQGGGYCLALLSLWLPRFSYKWFAAPGCQCSSRHNVRLSGPGGTKSGVSVRLETSSCLIHGRVHGHCG